jgi:hypothetical protein
MTQLDEASNLYGLRIIKYQGSLMINLCDLDLVGSKLCDGGMEIELSKDFFRQEITDSEGASDLLRSCSIANLVGTRIVKQAIDLRLAKENSVRRISGIPFLMIYKFQHSY